MKVTWDKDEWWPVYLLNDDDSGSYGSAEVSPELYARYCNAQAEWQSVQDELANLLNPSGR